MSLRQCSGQAFVVNPTFLILVAAVPRWVFRRENYFLFVAVNTGV
jgi:hypothetical protein